MAKQLNEKVHLAPWFARNSQIHGELDLQNIRPHITKLNDNYFSSLPISYSEP